MLRSNTAVDVAKKLVRSSNIQSGLKKTAAAQRRDLAVESIMLEPEFETLFNDEDLKLAEWRLKQV